MSGSGYAMARQVARGIVGLGVAPLLQLWPRQAGTRHWHGTCHFIQRARAGERHNCGRGWCCCICAGTCVADLYILQAEVVLGRLLEHLGGMATGTLGFSCAALSILISGRGDSPIVARPSPLYNSLLLAYRNWPSCSPIGSQCSWLVRPRWILIPPLECAGQTGVSSLLPESLSLTPCTKIDRNRQTVQLWNDKAYNQHAPARMVLNLKEHLRSVPTPQGNLSS